MRSSKLEDLPNFHLRIMVQMMMEPPTLVAMTMRTMRAVWVIPVEDEDRVDGVALALEEAVLVMITTGWEAGDPACAGVAVVAKGLEGTLWVVDGVNDVDWVLVGEVEDDEDVDEEVKLVVAVVGRTWLTLCTVPADVYRRSFSSLS
jgi:hypothetical protein